MVLEIGKSISYHFKAQKVLSILNLPRPVSNVSCTAHTKAPEKAVNERLERELKNAMLQVKRPAQAYFFCSLIQLEKWETPILLMI